MGLKEELKHDVADPVEGFAREVYDDTVVDAKRFYTAQARKLQQKIRLAEKRTQDKAAAIRRQQEEMKKRRKDMMKRAAIVFAALIVALLVIFSLALRHGI